MYWNINEFVLLEEQGSLPHSITVWVVAKCQELGRWTLQLWLLALPRFLYLQHTLESRGALLLRGFLELQQDTCQWEALPMFKAQRRFLALAMPQFPGSFNCLKKREPPTSWRLKIPDSWMGKELGLDRNERLEIIINFCAHQVFKCESNPQMSIYLLIHIGLLIINIYHETKGKTAFINIRSVFPLEEITIPQGWHIHNIHWANSDLIPGSTGKLRKEKTIS